jgi:FMN-dependent NADH-azoreductase
MKLLHVDASPKGALSNSRALGRHFLEALRRHGARVDVDYLDLSNDVPPHVSEAFIIAAYTPEAARTNAMRQTLAVSDALCRRLMDADFLVFAMPMYNFSVPSAFKAYIDCIVRAGVTYTKSPEGVHLGMLTGKKVLFITTRGADMRPGTWLAANDALTPSLRSAFGFIGVMTPAFVDAQPVQFSTPQAREEALQRARLELDQVAASWAKHEGATA